MLIIPAIDLVDGRCVRLIQGDYSQQLSYDADPVDTAKRFVDAGAELVHVVDLDGAKQGEPQNWSVIGEIAKVAAIEVGGGVRSISIAERLLGLGVYRVVVGTKLVQDEHLAAEFFKRLSSRVVAGIDARDGMVATHGWTEASTLSATELAMRIERQGGERIILTDIARDGMLSGPNTSFLQQVANAVTIPIIASGGVGSVEDVLALAGMASPPEGVIIGRALYDGKVSLEEALAAAK